MEFSSPKFGTFKRTFSDEKNFNNFSTVKNSWFATAPITICPLANTPQPVNWIKSSWIEILSNRIGFVISRIAHLYYLAVFTACIYAAYCLLPSPALYHWTICVTIVHITQCCMFLCYILLLCGTLYVLPVCLMLYGLLTQKQKKQKNWKTKIAVDISRNTRSVWTFTCKGHFNIV